MTPATQTPPTRKGVLPRCLDCADYGVECDGTTVPSPCAMYEADGSAAAMIPGGHERQFYGVMQ